jgi:hypothetical protein
MQQLYTVYCLCEMSAINTYFYQNSGSHSKYVSCLIPWSHLWSATMHFSIIRSKYKFQCSYTSPLKVSHHNLVVFASNLLQLSYTQYHGDFSAWNRFGEAKQCQQNYNMIKRTIFSMSRIFHEMCSKNLRLNAIYNIVQWSWIIIIVLIYPYMSINNILFLPMFDLVQNNCLAGVNLLSLAMSASDHSNSCWLFHCLFQFTLAFDATEIRRL